MFEKVHQRHLSPSDSAVAIEPYAGVMQVRAADVARELRRRLPGVPKKKLHKLLYLCQGHHLAHGQSTLFTETLSAWDHGPVVGELWHQEDRGLPQPDVTELDEGQLNTVGYVVSRYGRLSGRDLEDLAHAQVPWQRANLDRPAGTSVRIDVAVMMDFFRSAEDDSEENLPVDRDAVRAWLGEVDHRAGPPDQADSPQELRRRILDAG